jgi:hypothetical protein
MPEIDLAGRKLGTADILVGAGLVLGLITTFLPWYSVSFNCNGLPTCAGLSTSSSVSGFNYWSGVLFFIFVLIGLALFVLRTFVPTVNLPAMPLTDAMLYMVIGLLMVLMAVIYLIATPGGTSGAGFSAGASFGLWIGIITGVAVAAGGFLKRTEPQPATRPLSSYGGSSTPPPPPPAV